MWAAATMESARNRNQATQVKWNMKTTLANQRSRLARVCPA